MNFTP